MKRVALTSAVVSAALVWVVAEAFPTRPAKFAIADAFFFKGPRLGTRPARRDIAIVHFEEVTAAELKRLPTVDQDLELYRILLQNGGARAVVDTRMIAEGETNEVRRLVEGMAALDARGRLIRDVWVRPASEWFVSRRTELEDYTAPDALDLSATFAKQDVQRFTPLLMAGAGGIQETLALRAARAGLDLPPSDAAEIARRNGIVAVWQALLPEGLELPESQRPVAGPRGPYLLGDIAIPWWVEPSMQERVLPAALWLDWGASPRRYPHFTYKEVLDGLPPKSGIEGRVVFVGYDVFTDPAGTGYRNPGKTGGDRVSAAELAAVAYQTIADRRFMRRPPPWVGHASIVLLALAGALLAAWLKPLPALAAAAGVLLGWIAISVAAWRAGWFPDLALPPLALLLSSASAGGLRYRTEERLRRRIQDLFGRYVPRAVVEDMIARPDAETLAVGGVKREVTVMFADIRGFTTWSDRLPPERVLEQLNGLLKVMVDCAFRHGGTVDKFIGDCVLVLFNAPRDQPDHALRAVRAAVEMQAALAGHPTGLAFGIGIHTGEAVVGTVGTPERMEYTAIGSTVNVTSRLCSTAMRGQIVISDAVQAKVAAEFAAEARQPMRVKGIDRDLLTYLVGPPPR